MRTWQRGEAATNTCMKESKNPIAACKVLRGFIVGCSSNFGAANAEMLGGRSGKAIGKIVLSGRYKKGINCGACMYRAKSLAAFSFFNGPFAFEYLVAGRAEAPREKRTKRPPITQRCN